MWMRSGCRWLLVVLAFCVGGLCPRIAGAQTAGSDELIAAGQKAHRLGKYGFAIAALEQAQRIAPHPHLLIAIANAHHQRFVVARAPYDRIQAILHYQEYLDATPDGAGSRRARRAIAALEALQLDADDAAMAKAAAADTKKTRLVVTSPVLGAMARVDGEMARRTPLFRTIKPGEHTIVVSAPGYQVMTRRIAVERGFLQVVSADLRRFPIELRVTGTSKAQVHLDGIFVGIIPFEEPIEVQPGTRKLEVTLNGHRTHTEQVTFKPGRPRDLDVDLDFTNRRIGSSVMLALGGAGVVTGLVFGIATLVADGSEDPEPLAREYRAVSGWSAGVGLGLSLFGAALFTFDEPELSVEPGGPGEVGATMRLRF